MDVFVIQVLAFISVLLLVIGISSIIRGDKADSVENVPAVFNVFSKEIEVIGRIIGPGIDRASPGQVIEMKKNIVAAALAPLEVVDIRGLQGLAASGLGTILGVLVFVMSMDWRYGLLGFMFFALLGWVYPVTWLSGAARFRKDRMSRSLPYAIDLITVAMQAGQDFGAAVRHLVTEGPIGPLRQEFSVMLREIELGKSRVEALKTMSERLQLDEFRTMVTSVIQSSEMGSSIAATLKIQAEEIRRSRYHKAEQQAARAPSLMIVPVALFILPSVFVMIFVPIILRIKGSGIGSYVKL